MTQDQGYASGKQARRGHDVLFKPLDPVAAPRANARGRTKNEGVLMDSVDWLLSAIDDPEAVRLNGILLLYFALIGVALILRHRGRVLAPARRKPHRAD
jgi:hypothetical protein